MSKTYNWIISLIGLTMLFWSCSAQNEEYYETATAEEAIKNNKEEVSLEASFRSDELSGEQLIGFESRAIQKLTDFGDYLEIISNTNYDRTLREHTVNLAIQLFHDDQSVVKMQGFGLKFTKILSIKHFLNGALNNEYGSVTIGVADVRFNTPFSLTSDSIYQGELLYSQTVERKVADEITTATEDKVMKVVIMKVVMEYGEESEEVWQVLFKEIK